MKRAYSYIRFSRSHQELGDSLRRQSAGTEDYCRRNNLALDDSLNLRDMGVSAFKGKNVETGALSRFIAACKNGLVPSGSALIVESLDRLSRQSPRKTVRLLTELMDDYGIEVHLTMTGKIFKPESEDGIDLIFAVAMAMRSHEESETKSRRLTQAFAKKRESVSEAITSGKRMIMTKSLPWWLVLEKDRIVSPSDRKKVLREIFKRVAGGESANRIAFDLNKRRIPTWRPVAKYWVDSRIRDVIHSDAPLGVLTETPKTRMGGRSWRIENYYPCVINSDVVAAARASVKRNRKSGRPGSKAKPANLLKSLIRFRGIWMRFDINERQGPKGHYWNGYYNALYPDRPGSAYMISANQLEPILLACLAELTPEELAPPIAAGSKAEVIKKDILKIQQKIANVGAAIEAGSVSMAPRLIALERELEESKIALDLVLAEIGTKFDAKAVKEVRGIDIADLKNINERPRIAAAIRRLIERIDVGESPSDLTAGEFVLETENGDTVIEQILPDPTGPRGKHPVIILVHFRGGAKRLIARGVNGTTLSTIVESKGKQHETVVDGLLTVRVAKPGDNLAVWAVETPENTAKIRKPSKCIKKLDK